MPRRCSFAERLYAGDFDMMVLLAPGVGTRQLHRLLGSAPFVDAAARDHAGGARSQADSCRAPVRWG